MPSLLGIRPIGNATLLSAMLLLSACATLPPNSRPPSSESQPSTSDSALEQLDTTAHASAVDAMGVQTSVQPTYLPSLSRRKAPQLELVAQIGGRAGGMAGAGDTIHLLLGGRIVTMDVADPSAPREIGRSELLPTAATQLRMAQGDSLLVAYGERSLQLLQPGRAAAPEARFLGLLELPERAHAVAFDATSGVLWVAASEQGLLAVDISDPSTPRIIGRLAARGDTMDVVLRDGLAYVVDRRAGLLIIDIADPTAPRELGRFDDDGDAHHVLLVESHLAYVTTTHRFWVVDISDPHHPRKVWQPKELPGPDGPINVRRGGALARIAGKILLAQGRLLVLDVDNPERPSVSHILSDSKGAPLESSMPLRVGVRWWALSPANNEAYELLHMDLLAAAGEPALRSRHDLPGPLELWWPVMLAGPRPNTLHYGAHLLDISDPSQPTVLGKQPYGEGYSFALDRQRGLAVTSHTESDSDALGIWSLEEGDQATHLASLRASHIRRDEPWQADRVALAAEMAYVRGSWGWGFPLFIVIDLSDPAHPRERSRLDESADISNYCRMVLSQDERHILAVDCGMHGHTSFEGGPGRLDLVDVTDPDGPIMASHTRTEHVAYDVAVREDVAFVAVGPRGLEIYDISDPRSPRRTAALPVGTFVRWTTVLPNGFLAIGDKQSLHLVDATDPEQPAVVTSLTVRTRDDLGGLAYVDGHLWVGARETGLLGYRLSP